MFLRENTTFEEYPSPGRFSRYLEEDEKCRASFNPEQRELILSAFDLSSRLHAGEIRSQSREPYITHPISLALEEIREVSSPSYRSIIVLLLHDVIESNPQCYNQILEMFGLDIFFRVLKLSKLSAPIRMEIQDYTYKHLSAQPENIYKRYVYLLSMLSPDDSVKENIFNSMEQHEEGDFKSLILSYRNYLINNCPNLSQEKIDVEMDGLWHYLFFDKADVRYKLRDTSHNLEDVPYMSELKKKDYLTRRMPKLQALIYVLRRYGMNNRIDRLMRTWQELGGNIDQYGQLTVEFPSMEVNGIAAKTILSMLRVTGL